MPIVETQYGVRGSFGLQTEQAPYRMMNFYFFQNRRNYFFFHPRIWKLDDPRYMSIDHRKGPQYSNTSHLHNGGTTVLRVVRTTVLQGCGQILFSRTVYHGKPQTKQSYGTYFLAERNVKLSILNRGGACVLTKLWGGAPRALLFRSPGRILCFHRWICNARLDTISACYYSALRLSAHTLQTAVVYRQTSMRL